MKNHPTHAAHAAWILVISLALCGQAFPQAISITNGAWSNAATWSTPPVNGASASVSGNDTVTFHAGDSYTGGYAIYTGLDVGQNFRTNPGSGVLNVTGGTLRTGTLLVGHDGVGYEGTINVSGGEMIIDGGTMLFGWGASSSLNVSGSGTVTMAGTLDPGNPSFNFGHSAQSFLTISNAGTVNIQRAVVVQAGSLVNVNGTNSTLNFSDAANLNLAAGSRLVANGGSINMSGGQVTINGTEGLWLGVNVALDPEPTNSRTPTTGTLNLSGGTWTQTGMFRLGVWASGNGIVNQTGGVFELGHDIEVWGSSVSQYNLAGGTFRLLGNYEINNYSTGSTFNITGASGNVTWDAGTNNFTLLNTSVFNNAGATLTKTGSGTLTFGGGFSAQLQIANGALDMQAGTIETASSLAIGIDGSSATGTMSGGTLKTGYIQAANFIIGFGQTGTFTQSNGAVDVGSQANAVIGWNAGGTGTYTLNGGSFSAVTNNTHIGFSGGTGTVNVAGGSFAAHNLFVGGSGAASGTLNLNGGTLSLANPDGFYVDSNGTLNLNSGGSLPAANIRVTSGGNLNFNGGTGNAAMNIFAGGGAGGTVDVKGQTLGAGSWANLIASGAGAVLKNSGTNASIAAGNTIWIWDGGGNLTINTDGPGALQIDSWITSFGQATPTGIIKTGTNALVLAGPNDYTGVTQIDAGIVLVTVASGLGSTSGGTTVADGAQLRLSSATGFTIGNEALTIAGDGGAGLPGALRNAAGTNTSQGKVTLSTNASIGAASGTSLTLDVASGNAIEGTNFSLGFTGAGSVVVNDTIALGSGNITKNGSGRTSLNVVQSAGSATISLGTLSINNALTLSNQLTLSNVAKLVFQVNPAGIAGYVNAPSGATLAGTVGVEFDPAYIPMAGASFPLVVGPISGTPALSLPTLSNSLVWVTNNFVANGTLSIASGAPTFYQSWLTNYPSLTGTNALPGADPDGDGYNNQSEFAFDGNPTVGSPALVSAAKNGTNVVVSFIGRRVSAGGATYNVLSTSNLPTGPFTNNAVATAALVDSTNQSGVLLTNDYVRRQFSVAPGVRDFYRIQANLSGL
jgi:autotransporter-associated beta strand protein